MKIFTIILNWNSWWDTLKCLQSLQSLDCPQTPLVIDNASTNDSVAKIREAFPSVELIESDVNLGFGGGCNLGISRALSRNADFVWLLNNDTTVDPGALTALVAEMKKDARTGAAGAAIYDMDRSEREQLWGGLRVRMNLGGVSPYRRQMPIARLDYIAGACCLLRAEAIRAVGLFDEAFFMYWEDADLGFRLRQGGWKLAVAGDSRIWHKGCASLGRRSTAHDIWNNRSAVRFFRRYARIPAIPLVLGGAYRIARRLALGDFRRIAAVAAGLAQGVGDSR